MKSKPSISPFDLPAQLERANRIIGWMMEYVGSMCPPPDGLFELNEHCCDNMVRPPGPETKRAPLNQRRIPAGGKRLRRRDESPVEYYLATGAVDDRFTSRHKGRFYCNPAHCHRSWSNEAERDEHLDGAYAALG